MNKDELKNFHIRKVGSIKSYSHYYIWKIKAVKRYREEKALVRKRLKERISKKYKIYKKDIKIDLKNLESILSHKY